MTDRPEKPDVLGSLSKKFKQMTADMTQKTPEVERAFFQAVINNSTDAVLNILGAGFDPNAYNREGQTALHVAVLSNAVAVGRLLIERGANPLLGRRDNPVHTPLEDAINFNKPEMVELLVRKGGYDLQGSKADCWSLLHRACEKGQTRAVELLLQAGANCNETTGNGSTPLLIAARCGHIELVRLLLQFPAVTGEMNTHFINTDARRRTAFQFAVDRGRAPLVAVMIAKGAAVNGRDAEGKPPLLYAIENGNLALVRLLAESAADLNASHESHGTPLAHACVTDAIDDEMRAGMVDLLIRMGADTDIPAPEGNMTPLHLIFKNRQSIEALAALLRYPVNTEICCATGETPLMLAAMKNAVYVAMLLKAGANVNARSSVDARTPLIQAVIHNKPAIVETLLKAGANPKLCDGHGKSAMSYAREKGQSDIIKLLELALQGTRSKQIIPPPG